MIESVSLALLYGAVVWLWDSYNESSLGSIYPKPRVDSLPPRISIWGRLWVYKIRTLKYCGLFFIWSGPTLGATYPDASYSAWGYFAGFVGFVLYVTSKAMRRRRFPGES